MAFLDEQKVVRQALASWSSTAVDWSDFNGGRFAPPEPDPAGGASASWIRPAVRVADAQRAELGPVAIRRTTGVVIVQVFVPIGAGDAIAASLAASVAAIFRDLEQNGMQFLEPQPRPVGPEPDGAWYQVNVEIPFRRDERI
ncbi:MAG TPA: phage tail terminator-like protein [Thermoanaerobaculia bacterium]|nr:phage tail terminator-like protein [Thermoanaerobaculia bacterium]